MAENSPTTAARNAESELWQHYGLTVVERLVDIDLFIHYIIVLFVSAKAEFEDHRKTHPDLGTSYDECRKRFKLQIQDLVEELRDA